MNNIGLAGAGPVAPGAGGNGALAGACATGTGCAAGTATGWLAD